MVVIQMSNKDLVIVYKEVGKKPEFIRVEKNLEILENLVNGELDFIPYDDIVIVARKDRDNLRANIYINTDFLSIGSSIRGNVFIVCKENENLKSLSKEQAIKYREFLTRASFNYENFDKNGKYIPTKNNNSIKNRGPLVFDKALGDDDTIPINNNKSVQVFDSEEVLKMILGIQAIVLKFIKNNVE